MASLMAGDVQHLGQTAYKLAIWDGLEFGHGLFAHDPQLEIVLLLWPVTPFVPQVSGGTHTTFLRNGCFLHWVDCPKKRPFDTNPCREPSTRRPSDERPPERNPVRPSQFMACDQRIAGRATLRDETTI